MILTSSSGDHVCWIAGITFETTFLLLPVEVRCFAAGRSALSAAADPAAAAVSVLASLRLEEDRSGLPREHFDSGLWLAAIADCDDDMVFVERRKGEE